jgi:hypothetical protein
MNGWILSHTITSVIVNNLGVVYTVLLPFEANAPLIIDANAVLSSSLAFQCFKSIRWRNTQIGQCYRPVQHDQLAFGNPLDVWRQLPGETSIEDFFSLAVSERLDHARIITDLDNIFKGYALIFCVCIGPSPSYTTRLASSSRWISVSNSKLVEDIARQRREAAHVRQRGLHLSSAPAPGPGNA